MASMFRPFSVVFVLTFLANAVSCIPSREFDSMLESLRERGYDLFCNAIVTSDLQFEVLSYQNQRNGQKEQEQGRATNSSSRHTFTFFAPTDASLFALDMTQTASSYTDTLRFHVVPRRLSVAELLLLPEGYALPTLLPHRRLDVMRSTAYAAGVSVGGVDIAFPGLFYGSHVAVHGLSGILSIRSNAVSGVSSVPPSPAPVAPPISSAERRWRSIPNFPENDTILAPGSRPVRPVPKPASFNVTSRRRPHPPVKAPAPGANAASRHSPASVPNAASSHAPAPVPNAAIRHAPAPVPKAGITHAPAPVSNAASRQAPATSPASGIVETPLPEADWTVYPPADSPPNRDYTPVVSPAASAPIFRDLEISLPPEGLSEAAVPAPAGLDLVVREKPSVSIMETSGGDLEGMMETTEKFGTLDGVRKCDVGIGLKDYDSHAPIFQCYAS